MTSNYPDDIASYDNHPSSPRYEEPTHLPCSSCLNMEYSDELEESPYTSDLLCPTCYTEVLEADE